MNMDEIILKLKSELGKIKSDISSTIQLTQKLDNTTNKASQSFNNIARNIGNVDNNFKNSKSRIQELENQLKSLSTTYKKESDVFKNERLSGSKQAMYNPTKDASAKFDPNALKIVTQKSLDEQRTRIEAIKQELNDLKATADNVSQNASNYKLVPKNAISDDIKNAKDDINELGDEEEDSNSKIRKMIANFKKLSNTVSKIFNNLKNRFANFSKSLSKGLPGNISSLKKLALGLIGVRTAMSVLTKSVNAYLSFDSELQDSLTNSWNMLGALLAPAIELVAHLFAMATNYVAQFVSSLTGIDLVARANAKALETQAKATKKANNAQRGLLGMDEITNLPTESEGTPANQIAKDVIKTNDSINKLLDALKNRQWHIAGETIAEAIDNALGNINWNKIQKTAHDIGYNIADFLNGAFELDWTQLGKTIANGLNTAIKFAFGFVEKFSFIQFGSGMGRAFSNMFTNIDWQTLAITISDAFIGMFNLISSFLANVDWYQIGESIKNFLVNIQWAEIASAVFKAMRNAFTGIDTLLTSVFGESTANIIEGIAIAIGAVSAAIAIMNAGLTITGLMTNPVFLLVTGLGLLIAGVIALAKHAESVANAIKKFFKYTTETIYNMVAMSLNFLIGALNAFLIPFRAIIVAFGKATGKSWTFNDVKVPKIPLLETGTPEIESEGLYHLHEGEMVVPKKYNPNTDGYNNGNDNKQIIDLLVSLNASMLEYADRPININMDGRKVASGIYDSLQEVSENRNTSNVVVRS